ncbi:Transcriptional regulatory protein AruR, partial [Durusdinium trenchii]
MNGDSETSQGARILFVEDDEELASQTGVFLSDRGYSVECANAVGPARALISQQPYDLYLLDIILPGVSGKVLCREIAETSRSGIIMVSSVSDDAERIALLELGADDYIVKPFNMFELLARATLFGTADFHRVERQTYSCTQTGWGAIGQLDFASVIHDDCFDDRQSQTTPWAFRIKALKGTEGIFELVWRDTLAVVVYGYDRKS